jgi:hypothetical protein
MWVLGGFFGLIRGWSTALLKFHRNPQPVLFRINLLDRSLPPDWDRLGNILQIE